MTQIEPPLIGDVRALTQHQNADQVAATANPLLAALIRRYIAERLSLGELNDRSANFTKRRVLSLAATCPSPPSDITRADIKTWLSSGDIAASTRAARLSAANSFFTWCVAEDLVTANPCIGIKRPKVPKGENRSLGPDEIQELKSVLPDTRAHLIISLMHGEGLRRAEVAAIEVHDIDFHSDTPNVRGKASTDSALDVSRSPRKPEASSLTTAARPAPPDRGR